MLTSESELTKLIKLCGVKRTSVWIHALWTFRPAFLPILFYRNAFHSPYEWMHMRQIIVWFDMGFYHAPKQPSAGRDEPCCTLKQIVDSSRHAGPFIKIVLGLWRNHQIKRIQSDSKIVIDKFDWIGVRKVMVWIVSLITRLLVSVLNPSIRRTMCEWMVQTNNF